MLVYAQAGESQEDAEEAAMAVAWWVAAVKGLVAAIVEVAEGMATAAVDGAATKETVARWEA
jgi:hypothetical protein